jgi:xylulokinase
MHFLGLDIGTSAVKAVLVDERQRVVAEASAPLVSHEPRPGWSEQDPETWWDATETVAGALRRHAPAQFRDIAAIGLSGQMHSALLLNRDGKPIRPAILWNDGRAVAECAELTGAVPHLADIAGVLAMPGFTAPKLLWLKKHEPDDFARFDKVLLAKDYVRLKLTGTIATDMSDAAGTLLLNEMERAWYGPGVAVSGLSQDQLPQLLEGPAISGTLLPSIQSAWGINCAVPVAAGAGDVAAGAIGIGAIEDGDSFISLGTSAQYFVTRSRYEPKPETLIHAFAHALPERWFEMAAMLNGAGTLDWIARMLGEAKIGELLQRVEARFRGPSPVIFLPYLSGERTPHNDPDARGGFFGLEASTDRLDLVQAVLDGGAFSFMDAQLALGAAGRSAAPVAAIGGGARSRFWLRLIASALGVPVLASAGADKGPAFGAARLARMALTGEPAATVCAKPETVEEIAPDPRLHDAYAERFVTYRRLYANLRRARAAMADRRPGGIR